MDTTPNTERERELADTEIESAAGGHDGCHEAGHNAGQAVKDAWNAVVDAVIFWD